MLRFNYRNVRRALGALAGLAVLIPLLAVASPAAAQTGATPVGYVDIVRAVDGGVEVAGWSYDADASDRSNWVHVYVNGIFVAELGANRLRQDVNDAFGITGRHGFGAVVAGGPGMEVCIYGLGTGPDGRYDANNALLSRGCTVVAGPPAPAPAPGPTTPPPPGPTPPPQPPVPAATPPLGYVDSIDSNLIGGLRVTGWAYDPDRTLAAVDVAIYLDDELAGTTVTDRSRPDVNAAVGITGAHGFSYDLDLDVGQHVICAVAMGVDSSGNPDGVDGPLPVVNDVGETGECLSVIFYPPACASEADKGDEALLACIDEQT